MTFVWSDPWEASACLIPAVASVFWAGAIAAAFSSAGLMSEAMFGWAHWNTEEQIEPSSLE